MTTFTFFSTEMCPNCKIVKRWLTDIEIDYVTLTLSDSRIALYGLQSVPTIIKFIDGKVVDKLEGMHSREETLAFFK